MRFLAVDIGGTAVKLGLVEQDGQIAAKADYPVDFDGYETPILSTVLRRAGEFLEEQGLLPGGLSAVGVSATGQIDVHTGEVIGSAGHIKNWLGSKLKEAFERQFGLPAAVLNDANAAVLGEQWVGCAKGCRDVVMVTIGTGVGGGVVTGGQLLEGRRGIAGELGHYMLNHDGERCSCGNRGCFERYASMSALVREARLRAEELGIEAPDTLGGKRLFTYYWDGHPGVCALVERWIGTISDGLIGLVHIFNPELVVIGGGVSREGERFLKKIRERVLAGAMPRFAEGLRVEPSALGNDAGLLGAARAAQKRLEALEHAHL